MRTPRPPDGWTWSKVKHLAEFFTGWTPPTGDAASFEGDNLWANISDLGERTLADTAKRISDEAIRCSAIRISPAGSLLFSFKLSIGQVSFAGRDLYTNEAIATFPPTKGFNPRWAYWAFPVFVPLNANENIYGAKLLNQELIRAAAVLVPPAHQQERIASFLDEQTARIDALIAEKERLAALLLEEEQSCIDKAVLAGQDPVPQFPFTPPTSTLNGAVWRRVALKRYWRVTDCKHLTVDFVEDGYPLASIREVSGGFLELGNAKRARKEDFLNLIEGGRQPHRGDLIYARNASVGAAAYVDTDEQFAMGQDVCLISSADQDQRFLRLQLMSSPVKAQLEGLLVGATIRRINVEQLRDFVVLVPPAEVQRAVVDTAVAELARRATLRLHLSEHIERLREYRSSLISAAVTGQLNIDDFKTQQLETA